ncbi:MAG: molecular chaperone HtpG [Candidatus Methanomethylophilaceae archaeon]|uniref:molecular chaperone HtpG n=1 Tax=Candidatus Methanarcanum hacksteinii TaxID=2911857 RepID=UPI002A7DEB60|nr:molecular chaperone HtpG [Candidatus Methanomethylophilaceae archaeon]MCI6024437.1 molecular chaperone HtpG [Methanomassiliicoccales archaeon]
MAKKQFKTESKRILDLMVNSIYTHKEIFLREIISNASDAIDKMNFKAMTDESLGLSKKDFRIDVVIDKDARTITVKDNGIGMTQDEMEKNLGVIAHSGSLDFKNENGDKKGADSIIGQFGVGFYSAFMVSDKVTVVSRPVGSDVAYRWESSGADGYSITECEKDSYGTDVIMHIKPDEKDEEYSEFLESYRIQELITMYSDYVRWPIHMMVEEGEWKETGEKDEKGNPKREYVTKEVDKVINSMVPIWQKNKKSATDEKCKEFYKTKFHDFEDPISVIRVNAEGLVSYKAMLFIPKRAPYDFYSRDYEPGLQLYSNGVLIMDKCADLLPFCFRFVKGVVDSQDFSLNISREVLQHDSQLKAIGENLKKKVKAELLRIMKDEPETYREFYKSFGRQLKYGVVEDYGRNREFLQDLLMFTSSEKDELISLDQYVDAMPEGQSNIYYVTGESIQQAKNMPQTEQVRDKGYDILVLTEDVDEFVMKTLAEYREKRMCNVTSDDLGLETEEEKKDAEQKEEEYKGLLDFAKEALDGKVSSVRISHKLKNHAVLLTSEGHITLEMEKYFAEMPGSEDEKMKAQRVLELNASHPAFNALNDAFLNDKEKAKDLIKIMYAQASIMAGLPLDDAVGYSDLVFKLF